MRDQRPNNFGKVIFGSIGVFLGVFVAASQGQTTLRFEVTSKVAARPGRLFVVIAKSAQPEPRFNIGEPESTAFVLARDVGSIDPSTSAALDGGSSIFPISSLNSLPPGNYYVQASLASNIDLRSTNAPGNLHSDVVMVRLNPRAGGVVKLRLTRAETDDFPLADRYTRFVKIRSQLLSRFHGRPIYLRAGVILPRDYGADRDARFPLRVHTGGYGARFTEVKKLMAPGSDFRRSWLSESTPQMIFLHLDGDGPYGDPYQVNSDNNGPYGDAITQELIPYVEQKYGAIAQPHARVLDGGSTGGWVSLALKVFYPDFFNGVWAFCPDSLDFRAFQLINIYADKNAYWDDKGTERPSARGQDGEVRFTIRHECQMENVMGSGDRWTMSGGQWGAWNAVYGPRGADGKPAPLWDPKTGVIDHSIVEHWKPYDLRMVLEGNWKTLAPKMHAKINIWIGDGDDYFLNNAVHLVDTFLKTADPPYGGRIVFGPRQGHCWQGIGEREMMQEMASLVQSSQLAPTKE